ncbi:10424_t:CDS:2 [Paraglomus occultum]|uniref:10424_t:CDS:1 n=1 Tax=Paraglomus occultum TaxID=144539 RepID=A0A9N8YWV5_9GLOM|nr:10424_t:CDS:2 [Paraglomus occultum]
MRSLTQLLLFIIISSSHVLFSSAQYTVTNPKTGQTWKAGENVKIQWKLSGTPEDTVDIRLVHGNPENFDFVICENVKATDGECEYTVDGKIKSGNDYAIVIGKDSKYTYSNDSIDFLSCTSSPSCFENRTKLSSQHLVTIIANGPLPGCPNMGGNACTKDLPCCSAAGYCGNSDSDCGSGCDAKYSFNNQCEKTLATTDTQLVLPDNDEIRLVNLPDGTRCPSFKPCYVRNTCKASKVACASDCIASKSYLGTCNHSSTFSKRRVTVNGGLRLKRPKVLHRNEGFQGDPSALTGDGSKPPSKTNNTSLNPNKAVTVPNSNKNDTAPSPNKNDTTPSPNTNDAAPTPNKNDTTAGGTVSICDTNDCGPQPTNKAPNKASVPKPTQTTKSGPNTKFSTKPSSTKPTSKPKFVPKTAKPKIVPKIVKPKGKQAMIPNTKHPVNPHGLKPNESYKPTNSSDESANASPSATETTTGSQDTVTANDTGSPAPTKTSTEDTSTDNGSPAPTKTSAEDTSTDNGSPAPTKTSTEDTSTDNGSPAPTKTSTEDTSTDNGSPAPTKTSTEDTSTDNGSPAPTKTSTEDQNTPTATTTKASSTDSQDTSSINS